LQDLRTLDVPLPVGGLQKHLMEDTVGQIPFDRMVIVGPTDSVAHAVSQIKTIGIGQALVVEDGHLVGIFTERDLLYKLAGRAVDLRQIPVSQVMTPDPEAVEEGEEIRVVINKMSVGGYRHVPIVKGNRPVGIISAKAVANYILKHSELEF
jgi:CBS domain-containing protein